MIGEPAEGDSIITTDSLNIVLDSSVGIDTEEGYLKFEQITIAKEIVQDYDGTPVYKPADELRKILDHGENRHVTDEHPEGGIVTTTADRKGFIENLTFSDSNELKSDIIVTCSVLGDAIRNGDKREVSIGFYSDTDPTPGVFNDTEYKESQRHILLDHLAFTKSGRCSRNDGCGIKGDSKPKKIATEHAPVTDAQQKRIKEADAIIATQRVDMIANISAKSPNTGRETLDSMSFDELKRLDGILKHTDSVPGFNPVTSDTVTDADKKRIDSAYAKVGGE